MSSEPMMYGGQAVIKGVMMRSPRFFAVSCRRETGEITTRVEPVPLVKRPAPLKWPFVRGAVALIDAMNLGIRALMWSASVAMEDTSTSEGARKEGGKASGAASGRVADIAIGGSLVFGLGFGILLFIILPNIIAGLLQGSLLHTRFQLNLVEGAVKVAFFLAYVSLVGLMPNIREVFQYHGAEHRAINTYEARCPLTLEATRDFGTIHVRCGTNFILIVLVLSIFAFSVLPWSSVLERVAWRLALLPLVAGVAYEIIRIAGRHSESKFMRGALGPGLALQLITTRPPSDDQVEVALAALISVVHAEEHGLDTTPASQDEPEALPASA